MYASTTTYVHTPDVSQGCIQYTFALVLVTLFLLGGDVISNPSPIPLTSLIPTQVAGTPPLHNMGVQLTL